MSSIRDLTSSGVHLAWRRRLVRTAVACSMVTLVAWPDASARAATAAPAACPELRWVAAWTAPPQSSTLDRLPAMAVVPATYGDRSLREVVLLHQGGQALRIHLGNRYGTTPLTIDDVTVGRRGSGASVLLGSMRVVTFHQSPSATIPAGSQVVSDPVIGDVDAFAELAISFHVVGSSPLDYHMWAGTANYVADEPRARDAEEDGAAFRGEISASLAIQTVDVLTSGATGLVVVLGDSISDGMGSTPGTNRRWPDRLARRLVAANRAMSVTNAGLSGNTVGVAATSVGPTGARRVRRDALAQSGVTDLIVYEGINDIYSTAPSLETAAFMIGGYQSIVAQAHRAGVRVVGATVTPAGLDPAREGIRRAINTWISSPGAFDTVVDFDAMVRDPADPSRLRRDYDAGFAHLNDAGARALASAVDLDHLQGARCV